MTAAIVQRVAFSVVALVVASILIYGATEALPGDYATASLGREASPELIERVRAEAGLDRSFLVRYGEWLGGLLQGDLGVSYATQQPVWDVIEPRLKNSLALAAMAVLFTVPLAVLLGVWTGVRQGGWFDGIVGIVTLIAVSLPEFVLGLFLAAIFGIAWGILPATSLFSADSSAFDHLQQLILPAAAAAGVTIGYIARMTRAATIDVLASDYIHAARLRGVGGVRLSTRHVVRNALIPTVNVIGNNIAWMLGGMVAVELVFSFPGIGLLLVDAVSAQNAPLIAAISIIVTAGYIGVNLLADITALLLNPRLKHALR